MRIRFRYVTKGHFRGGYTDYLTVGYWWWTERNNKGRLNIECIDLGDWRMNLAVKGHEFIEAMWCKLWGITTEECDHFDDWAEDEYNAGRMPKEFEAGFHRDCPYRVGHVLGSWWEIATITVTLCSWTKYGERCNQAMGIDAPAHAGDGAGSSPG